jgi:hypothetical protein
VRPTTSPALNRLLAAQGHAGLSARRTRHRGQCVGLFSGKRYVFAVFVMQTPSSYESTSVTQFQQYAASC